MLWMIPVGAALGGLYAKSQGQNPGWGMLAGGLAGAGGASAMGGMGAAAGAGAGAGAGAALSGPMSAAPAAASPFPWAGAASGGLSGPMSAAGAGMGAGAGGMSAMQKLMLAQMAGRTLGGGQQQPQPRPMGGPTPMMQPQSQPPPSIMPQAGSNPQLQTLLAALAQRRGYA
jgi:hypothetical protein